MSRFRALALVALACAGLAACATAGGEPTALVRTPAPDATSTTTAAPTVPSTPPPPPTTAAPTTTTAPPPPPAARRVADSGFAPFASVGGITLVHPSARVERVAFHQSNHEGAREMATSPTAVMPTALESRERLTSGQTAADIVIDPTLEVRSPVTGRVKRSGGYTLYCKHRDEYVVIAPDANPAWEVKILHISGVGVRAGARVVAGETVIAAHPTPLPFASQVDELRTADPAWPHAHVEVVDPSIPNVTSPGSGCS